MTSKVSPVQRLKKEEQAILEARAANKELERAIQKDLYYVALRYSAEIERWPKLFRVTLPK